MSNSLSAENRANIIFGCIMVVIGVIGIAQAGYLSALQRRQQERACKFLLLAVGVFERAANTGSSRTTR